MIDAAASIIKSHKERCTSIEEASRVMAIRDSFIITFTRKDSTFDIDKFVKDCGYE